MCRAKDSHKSHKVRVMTVCMEAKVKGTGDITQGEFKEKKTNSWKPVKHQHLWAEKEEQAEDRSRVLSGKRTVESHIQEAQGRVSRSK